MKWMTSLLALMPLLIEAQDRTSQKLLDNGFKKYELKSARIDFVISGDAMGEETLVFDQYGWLSNKKRSMRFKLHGITNTQEQQEIRDGELVFRLNLKDSTLRKRVDKKWSSQLKPVAPREVSETVLFQLGGSYQRDTTLLDRTCQVWTFKNKTLEEMWIWKGLALKTTSRLGDGKVVTEARKIDLDAMIPATSFQIPAHFREQE